MSTIISKWSVSDKALYYLRIFDGKVSRDTIPKRKNCPKENVESQIHSRKLPKNLLLERGVMDPLISKPPSLSRTTSKTYVRLEFRGGRSKTAFKPHDYCKGKMRSESSRQLKQKQEQKKRNQDESSDIVKEVLQEAQTMQEHEVSFDGVIEPLYETAGRFSHMIGQPAYRQSQYHHQAIDKKTTSSSLEHCLFRTANCIPHVASERHRGQSGSSVFPDIPDDQTECGGSIATVSDLDNLAAKSLRKKQAAYALGRSQVSLLRKEIKEIVIKSEKRENQEPTPRSSIEQASYEQMEKEHEPANENQILEANDALNVNGVAVRPAGKPGMIMWCQVVPTLDAFFSNLRQLCTAT